MSEYNKKLDEIVSQMKIAYEASLTAQAIVGDHLDGLVKQIHASEGGNIKEPLHVLHWRTGLRALHALSKAQDDITEAIHVYTKNREQE